LFFLHLSGGMGIEEPHLADGGRTHESCMVVELRADLHAGAAGDAARIWIRLLLILCGLTRAGTEVIGAVDGYPVMKAFEILEEHGAVDREVAHHGKLAERLDANGLLEFVE